MATVVTVICATHVQLAALRTVGLLAALATLSVSPAPPVRADMIGNAFLLALTNAGVPYTQPATTTALGQSVCPMLVAPGGSFDAVLAKLADGNGMSNKAAGIFTLVAIATYCPAMLQPLLPHRLNG